MPTDYGSDLSCVTDLEEEGRVITDPQTLITQALLRRWTTPRGMLLDDEDYGTDLSEYLNDDIDALSLNAMRSDLRSEALKDERVRAVTIVGMSYDQRTMVVKFSLTIDTYDGITFPLTIGVSDVTVQLLEAA